VIAHAVQAADLRLPELLWLCTRIAVPSRKLRLDAYQWLVRLFAPPFAVALEDLAAVRPFLITSTGRTGTRWLAQLLNAAPGAVVMHEPFPGEQYFHARALVDAASAAPYLREFRLLEMSLRIRARRPAVYGEVNGALRRHVAALAQLAPAFRIVHLVRHPRAVIESMMNRPTFGPDDHVYGTLAAPQGVEPDAWRRMDRFERVCWMWAEDNAFIRRHARARARLEDITRSYEDFQSQVLAPLSLTLHPDAWGREASVSVNATRRQTRESWRWNAQDEAAYARWCVPELAHYGYADA
jgi:hypothetical protein